MPVRDTCATGYETRDSASGNPSLSRQANSPRTKRPSPIEAREDGGRENEGRAVAPSEADRARACMKRSECQTVM